MSAQVCHRLFLLFILVSSVCLAQRKPQFVRDESAGLVISRIQNWNVDLSNKIVFLNDGARKRFTVSLTGGSCTNRRQNLLVKCPGSSGFTVAAQSKRIFHCEATLPFSIECSSVSGRRSTCTFHLRESKLSYMHVFNTTIELKMQVTCEEATLESGSLFVYNLSPLLNIHSAEQSGIIDVPITRRLLTERGVQFLAKLDSTDEYGSIDFIDDSVVRVVNGAPDFIKPKFYAGGVISTAGSVCSVATLITSSPAFVNAGPLSEFNMNLQQHIFLNISSGKLYFAIQPVTDAVIDRVASQTVLSLCVTAGISGKFLPLGAAASVTDYFVRHTGVLSYTKVFDKTSDTCHLPDGVSKKSMTIFSGLDTTLLVCPIICSKNSVTFTFKKNGMALAHTGSSQWYTTSGMDVEVHKSYKFVRLPNILTSSHSGDYVCSAGGVTFTFDVRVVSLPHFHSQGLLPNTIYAMEGEQLTYNCTAAFANIQSVTVTPKFETNQVSGGKWQKMDIGEFNDILKGESVTSSVSSTSESKTLTLSVSRVPAPSEGKNLSHRFVCEVNVSSADSAKLGMPSYSVASGADVIFLKRPILSDFSRVSSCSASACTPESGAEFSVTLSSEMTQQLNSEGVQVTAYFKYNEFILSEVQALKDPEVSATTFDNKTNRLTFKLNQITKQEVLDAVKSANLTPVFNFRYKDGSSMQNLKIHKSAHGSANAAFGNKDCLADKNCFYSTEFDIEDQLKGLEFELKFTGSLVRLSEPAFRYQKLRAAENRIRSFCRSFCN